MSTLLPKEYWDMCPYCGWVRMYNQGNNSHPRCARQGCAGQHTKKKGLPYVEDGKK